MRGKSTPAMRAIQTSNPSDSRGQSRDRFKNSIKLRAAQSPSCPAGFHPWRCRCLGFSQITRTTPRLFTILHLAQIFRTDDLTFIQSSPFQAPFRPAIICTGKQYGRASGRKRSEEHTSELQSRLHLVCRLLLEKKKNECNLLNNQDI